jgi:tetratricopeptide (TPR) repeat protein
VSPLAGFLRLTRPSLGSALLTLLLCGPGCATATTAGRDVLLQGVAHAEAGNIEAAIVTLEGGVESYPNNVTMRFALSRLQYEMGEVHHLNERQARRQAEVFMQRGEREAAITNLRVGTEHRARATPYYQSARENLREVIALESDDHKLAWASYLLMKCDVFFEDYEEAYLNLSKAIELGRPTGSQLSQWREYQAALREKVSGGHIPY